MALWLNILAHLPQEMQVVLGGKEHLLLIIPSIINVV